MEKKSAPPPPPRIQRPSLSKQEEETEEQQSGEEVLFESGEEEGEAEEVIDESKFKDIQNGIQLKEEKVDPRQYNLYRFVVKGKQDDVAVLDVQRVVHSAAVNIFVNIPRSPNEPPEHFPTFHSHDWNPTLGQLSGPVGEYKISVQGVPSFIEKDDKYLVDPKNNTASYDLQLQFSVLDEETKTRYKKMADQYSREKSSSVWSSAYNKEILSKYQQQQEEYERELKEREASLVKSEVNLEGTTVAATYELSSVLGRGDFTVVKRGKHKKENKEYAVKIIDKDAAKEAAIEETVLKQQIDILKQLQNKNICGFKEFFDTARALCIVLDLYLFEDRFSELTELNRQPGKDVIRNLSESPSQPYTENDAKRIISQLLSALEYIHSKNIIHKSVVPENILLSDKDNTKAEVKLGGFQLSQISKEDSEQSVSGGDTSFQAPELIQQQPFGKAVDLWSTGIIAYILLCGYHPFKDSNLTRLKMKIRQGNYQFPEEDWKSVSQEAKEFVKKLICTDPAKRLTAKQALEQPWMKSNHTTALPGVRSLLAKYYE